MGQDTSPSAEWDAVSYHRLSGPQVTWGERVLDSLPLRGHETVLDAGCGTGRLTAELLARLPRGRVIAVDRSQNMLELAREYLTPRFGERVTFLQADLASLRLEKQVDAIFSTATLHWVVDHPRLFRSLYAALKSGGRLVAQCGGGPNLARLLERASALLHAPPYASYFEGWQGPWEFADASTTAERLRAAGFVDIETSVEPAPTVLASAREYEDFVSTVIFRLHLERMPNEKLRMSFLRTMTEDAARDDPPYSLDYWRLNLQGRRP